MTTILLPNIFRNRCFSLALDRGNWMKCFFLFLAKCSHYQLLNYNVLFVGKKFFLLIEKKIVPLQSISKRGNLVP